MKFAKVQWRKIAFVTMSVLFFASVPFAMWYTLNFDKYGTIDSGVQPVFIQIIAIDTPRHNNDLRIFAAKYSTKHHGVKIFVLPLSTEQSNPLHSDIKIVRDGDVVHAFVSSAQPQSALQHCYDFLSFWADNTQIDIQKHRK